MRYVLMFNIFCLCLHACAMGKRSVPKRPLFKSLFYMGDDVGMVYKKECPGKRAKSGACKVELKKVPVNFCEESNFKEFQKERYILIKETDFLL